MKSKTPSRRKKPYRSPRLAVYGDLRRLTAAKGGVKSESGLPKTKTTGPA